MGLSLGGMIGQRLAIDHAERLLTLTSVMSRTGEPEYGNSSPEAWAVVTAPTPRTRDEYIEREIAQKRVYGSKPEWIDEPYLRARAARAFDRCFCPAGSGRQAQAATRDGDRSDGLRVADRPDARDARRPRHAHRPERRPPHRGARFPVRVYVEIEGMGHDYPAAVWDLWVDTWASFVRSALAS